MHVFLIIQTASENPRKVSCSVLLPDADRHGAYSQGVSGERDNGNFCWTPCLFVIFYRLQ